MVAVTEEILMDVESQITDEESRRIGEAYASMCLERPVFTYRLFDWEGDQARRLAASRGRLLREFDSNHETSLDDILGYELAECYLAHDEKRYADAVRRLERSIAALLIAVRAVRLEMSEESNG